MKNSREQFEERFPTPAGIRWNEMYECYTGQSNAPYLALWMGWKASREAIELPAPCLEKTVGPNPFRSNYAVGWDDCRAEMTKRIGVEP